MLQSCQAQSNPPFQLSYSLLGIAAWIPISSTLSSHSRPAPSHRVCLCQWWLQPSLACSIFRLGSHRLMPQPGLARPTPIPTLIGGCYSLALPILPHPQLKCDQVDTEAWPGMAHNLSWLPHVPVYATTWPWLALPSPLPEPTHTHANKWSSPAWPDPQAAPTLMLTSGSDSLVGESPSVPHQAHSQTWKSGTRALPSSLATVSAFLSAGGCCCGPLTPNLWVHLWVLQLGPTCPIQNLSSRKC